MVNSNSIVFSITTANRCCCYSSNTAALIHYSSSFKLHNQLRISFGFSSQLGPFTSTTSTTWHHAISSDSQGETSASAGGYWDNLGYNPVPTDFMYTMKCLEGEDFSDGGLQPFGSIQLIPSACILNYGQAIIEDLRAYKKQDDSILLFRPEEHGLRMTVGANRLCMPAPTIQQFVEAVKVIVSANRRWIPPPDKGFLHIRALLMGTGAVLSVTPAPEFTFFIYVTPVGKCFEESLKPINLVVENEVQRATCGGVGGVNAISNYAVVLKAQAAAIANDFSDVLFLDSVHNRYLEEVSTANIFVVKV
ncbi:branched-chain amino acid aminotransferase 2, chloroplastic-like [Pistacia vera]|uniref:branched-chain amino acid aminotransferase 2, chloroplastic-like n=1 Tax=Pistacia vera TaxID=55513 RepID=UPI001263C2DC|nr:branched-chain amino acid aminotransferase 2, chloroplastic-like [Pistacia vera]